MRAAALTLVLALCSVPLVAQQGPDRLYQPPISKPAYDKGSGPVVCVDGAHTNFHTLDDGFFAFGELLRRDGYVTRSNDSPFTRQALQSCDVLVIANAQPGSADWNSYPYPTPSAFTDDEITAVRTWVEGGGALLLIADHLPLAGAAASLAATFGVKFTNGFALEGYETPAEREASLGKPTIFSNASQTLRPHAIVRGRDPNESVTSIRTFTGQAFQADGAAPLLVFPKGFIVLMPEKAWQFRADTPRIPADGWLQGAVMLVKTGRAAFFGEAAMFTAQVAGPDRFPIGMNAPMAEQNHRLVLNLMHWLSGILQ
jgi:hypothetical protein